MRMAIYGRMCRYKRIVEGLQLVLEDLTDDEAKARQWIGDALQLMQEKLDQTSEEYYRIRKEVKEDEEWCRTHRAEDPDDC